jgi:hypothetical protein
MTEEEEIENSGILQQVLLNRTSTAQRRGRDKNK